MEDLLTDVKCIVRSILVTEKGGMTIPQLEREYRSNEGQPVPYAKFGCRSIREFLNKISDTVRITNVNGEERVQAKGNSDLEHIDRMVKQQKPSATKAKVKHSMVHNRSQRGRPASSFGQRNRFRNQGTRQPLPTPGRTQQAVMRPQPAAMRHQPAAMQPRAAALQPLPSAMQPLPSAMQPSHSAMQPPQSTVQPSQSTVQPQPRQPTTQAEWATVPPPFSRELETSLSEKPEMLSSLPEKPETSSPQPSFTSSTNNEKAPDNLSKLHDLLYKRSFPRSALKSRSASKMVSVEADTNGQAGVQIPDSSSQGSVTLSVQQLLEAAASTSRAQADPQGAPNAPQHDHTVMTNADPWKGDYYVGNGLAQYPQPLASAPTVACLPVFRPWGAPVSPCPPTPQSESGIFAGFSAVQQQRSVLNPTAAEYKPEVARKAEGVSLHVAQASATVRKVFADKQTQAAGGVEMRNKETSTIDLAIEIPPGFSSCVRSLLGSNASGLSIEVLLEKCRHKLGDDAYFMQKKLPVEMARDVLFAVPSVCVISDYEGKFKVMPCSDNKGGKSGSVLPDDLIHGLMSVLFDYPEGLDASDLLHMHDRRFGKHKYLLDHCQNTFDFVRNVLVALPCTSLVSHGDGRYTVSVYREKLQDDCLALVNGRAGPLSSAADGCDSLAEVNSYSTQEVPQDQPFPVIVGEVFNPAVFYVLITTSDMFTKFDTMMSELDKFYSSAAGDFYVVQSKDLRPGLACAALYADGKKAVWHRAVIKSVRVHSAYVTYVDYGTVMSVKIEDIRRLRGDFLELPAQAIKAALAGVKPKGANTWPSEANNRFLELLRRGRSGQCMCSVWGKEDDTHIVELVQKFEDTEYSIGDVLVNDELAERTVGSGPGATDSCIELWTFSGGLRVHVITWDAEQYVSGMELSKLWDEQGDLVTKTLAEKGIHFPTTVVERRLNPELHYQICCSEGALRPGGIHLYCLQAVPDILRLLQHPSPSLLAELERRLGRSNSSTQDSVSSLLATVPGDGCKGDDTFRQKLCSKLEAWKKRRGELRMALYEKSDPSVLADLEYAEKKVESIAKVLNQLDTDTGTLSMAEDLSGSWPSIDFTDKCDSGATGDVSENVHKLSGATNISGATDNVSENVVHKFQNKLLEALKASKSK